MNYRTIVADPPWAGHALTPRAGGRRARPTAASYAGRTLTVEQVAALPVGALAAPAAHLYLWATRRVFREGEAVAVARAWGFEPCGELIWGLRNPGMGGFLGNGHEPILLAARGGLAWPSGLPVGVTFWRQLYAANGATPYAGKVHSAKPEGFLDLVEQTSPPPRVELFARRARLGWDTWGDEALGGVQLELAT